MQDFQYYLENIGEYGVVEQISYPLLFVSGLKNVHYNEMVISEGGELGVVFAMGKETVQILLVSKGTPRVGDQFARTNEYISVPIGDVQLGWVIDPLGFP